MEAEEGGSGGGDEAAVAVEAAEENGDSVCCCCRRVSAWHTCAMPSACVSMRQHASACVSIRQHTSAYVKLQACERMAHLRDAGSSMRTLDTLQYAQ